MLLQRAFAVEVRVALVSRCIQADLNRGYLEKRNSKEEQISTKVVLRQYTYLNIHCLENKKKASYFGSPILVKYSEIYQAISILYILQITP